ncbi:uncharacterized protein LOC120466829 isoform X2 [Pimephales promelas]|uniref:uncharacterized protein LOC120466829 isoform X2 n=1 Tax=Pimephales promelas TaxID=90988 RepID=UPI001955DEB9|nr:uncharacterized protein LOC120466829 isoform X2 [Pimephales promelas]
MAFIKEESEDMKIEESFRVKEEDTEEQTEVFQEPPVLIIHVSTVGPKAVSMCQGQSCFHCHFRGLIGPPRGQRTEFFSPRQIPLSKVGQLGVEGCLRTEEFT